MTPRAAYTLMEVLCSIAIAAIVATSLFVGFNNGFAILRTTREDLRATQILMQKTEAIRLLTWSQLSSNSPSTFQEYYNPGGAATNAGVTLYVGTISSTGLATNIPNGVLYKSNIYLVTITVAWTNMAGSKQVGHFRQMQTMAAKAGMQNYLSR